MHWNVLCESATDRTAAITISYTSHSHSIEGCVLARIDRLRYCELPARWPGKTNRKLWKIAIVAVDGKWPGIPTFSPDGKTLSVISGDRIDLWDTATFSKNRSLSAHAYGIPFVRFSPDGKTLASVRSYRAAVQIWHIRSGKNVALITKRTNADTERVNCLAFNADGTRLAIAYSDGTIEIWRIEGGE